MADKYTYLAKLKSSEIKEIITTKIEEFKQEGKEYTYRETEDNTLWLGIEKGDHAGYWYIAKLTDTENGCFIDGKVVYDPDKEGSKNLFSDIVEYTIIGFCMTLYYIVCGVPLFILWLIGKCRKGNKPVNYLDLFMVDYLGSTKLKKKEAKEFRKLLNK